MILPIWITKALIGSATCRARASWRHEPFILNTDDLSSFGLLGPDNREIDLGIKGDVEIVGEDIDRHVRDDFANLRLRQPSLLYPVKIGITDASAFLQ